MMLAYMFCYYNYSYYDLLVRKIEVKYGAPVPTQLFASILMLYVVDEINSERLKFVCVVEQPLSHMPVGAGLTVTM